MGHSGWSELTGSQQARGAAGSLLTCLRLPFISEMDGRLLSPPFGSTILRFYFFFPLYKKKYKEMFL